ncbi:hypothetical protein [Heyndrickxia oleronia]|nr:hypothetical protein [Heyndrickxia oleronia]MBU5213967.1 hypothetical protein [Heyndrickxia oleronia]
MIIQPNVDRRINLFMLFKEVDTEQLSPQLFANLAPFLDIQTISNIVNE